MVKAVIKQRYTSAGGKCSSALRKVFCPLVCGCRIILCETLTVPCIGSSQEQSAPRRSRLTQLADIAAANTRIATAQNAPPPPLPPSSIHPALMSPEKPTSALIPPTIPPPPSWLTQAHSAVSAKLSLPPPSAMLEDTHKHPSGSSDLLAPHQLAFLLASFERSACTAPANAFVIRGEGRSSCWAPPPHLVDEVCAYRLCEALRLCAFFSCCRKDHYLTMV